ncbi:MAG TPA: hypothetical protein VI006_03855 [Solirubrobacteraceae bacterium]
MARPRRVPTAGGDKELSLPPADFAALDPELVEVEPATRLLRLYAPAVHNATPAGFRTWGPLNRFDHHRAPPEAPRGIDRERGIVYAASALLCVAGEFFGDQGEITLPGARLARLTVTEPLRLLDLRGTAATGAGTIPAIGAITQRATTQAWARWWYEHPQLPGVEGLLYTASHSGQDAVALSERTRGKVVCRSGQHWALDDPVLADDLELVAYRLRLPIARAF